MVGSRARAYIKSFVLKTIHFAYISKITSSLPLKIYCQLSNDRKPYLHHLGTTNRDNSNLL